jgi:poly(A) polymerase/tRNA nucleotidyltransferase (CCA-adding enzyme)
MIDDLLADPDLGRILTALPRARVVGGAVRDAIAGRGVADIDLATPEPPEVTSAALEAAGFRVIPTGLAHGTVTAVRDGRPFEITTLRRDVATDGRHAEVAWTDDWREDAARRDFTINSMSLDRAGTVHDYFGGQEDLAAGIVRFVGEPGRRIAEDYLRILRFFRFLARYGRGARDTAALEAIGAGVPGLARISPERIWSELKKILTAPDPVPAVLLMDELGVLAAVLPEGAAPHRLAALAATGAPPDPLLRLAALATGNAAGLKARLNLSNAEAARLTAMQEGPVPRPDDTDATLRRLLADETAGALADRSFLHANAGAGWESLRARLTTMPRPVFPLEGRDALAMGAAPGPAIGEALRQTRFAWLAQGCTVPRNALLGMLRAHLVAAGAVRDGNCDG